MDLRQVIASAPLLWRIWRWLPGPMRFIALGLALVVWLWRRGRGEPPEGGAGGTAA